MALDHKRKSSARKTEFWRKHVNAWRENGLSQVDYSRQAGVAVKALGYWKRKFERDCKHEQRETPTAPTIVAVQLPQIEDSALEPAVAPEHRPLFVHLQNGLRIEIPGDFTASVLEKLLKTLERVA